MTKNVAVVGAGLVGSLQAIFLCRRGYKVSVFEKRSDMRKDLSAAGRSINLVVTSRGIKALNLLGLQKIILKETVPVYGRMMHDLEGNLTYQPYGNEGECNYSISRSRLNCLMMDLAAKEGANIQFNKELKSLDLLSNTLFFKDDHQSFDLVFGAEGAGSIVRRCLLEATQGDESLHWLNVNYKELLMPATSDGSDSLKADALHIWPRGEHFLMALPNLDGSFTMTVYIPPTGEISFEALNSDHKIKKYFQNYYPDFIKLCPDYLDQFKANPAGKLGTLKCSPWHYRDKAVLMGDAAHAITPFFGQGMNAGFEDCDVLHQLTNQFNEDYGKIFAEYTRQRKPNGDAIADMAIENYYEMSEKVGDPKFLLKKAVEKELCQRFPEKYNSRYRMVAYGVGPFVEAYQQGQINEQLLARLCQDKSDLSEIDWEQARQKLS